MCFFCKVVCFLDLFGWISQSHRSCLSCLTFGDTLWTIHFAVKMPAETALCVLDGIWLDAKIHQPNGDGLNRRLLSNWSAKNNQVEMQMLIPSRRCHQQHGYRGCWLPSASSCRDDLEETTWIRWCRHRCSHVGWAVLEWQVLGHISRKKTPPKCSSKLSKPKCCTKSLHFDRNSQNLNLKLISWGKYFEEASNSGPDRLTWQQFSPENCNTILFNQLWYLIHPHSTKCCTCGDVGPWWTTKV